MDVPWATDYRVWIVEMEHGHCHDRLWVFHLWHEAYDAFHALQLAGHLPAISELTRHET